METIESLKPEYYIKTSWEPIDGYNFPQPIERLNGKSYYEYPEDSYERNNWGKIYWDSRSYNDALDSVLFDSDFWRDSEAKLQAFNIVYSFIKSGKSGQHSSITRMFPFEIELMNNGFKMMSFCELNAINTGLKIIADKVIGNEVINPRGVSYDRWYKRGEDEKVYLGFGCDNANFYFELSKYPGDYFQVENNLSKFNDAINGKLKKL